MYYKVSGVTGKLTGTTSAAYAPQVSKEMVLRMNRGFGKSDVTFMQSKRKLLAKIANHLIHKHVVIFSSVDQ